MGGKLTKALWQLIVLVHVVMGICPLASATLLIPSHNGQCHHERVPAGGPHSCCVSVHHQPALVRPMPENSCTLPTPAFALKPVEQAVHVPAIAKIILSSSPPALASVLRI